ncbi:hypothetical protein ABG82_17560 [Mycobacteroides immunogenum]|uniref:Trypsin n=1 Tax=Mycobacteroides immunogenum TaxID=83262 RepID=A0A7V8RW49_9MYCO|nr:hypothetical protein ABG82_17560 [Mycobacteroides immunogenum]KPG07157.1 hypothetical protein AN909_17135 [Mycobacteroides immunogenum]KPG07374.1 hypothetical protein AN910_20435 [Mycobacteroides immunogenum]KPG09734.1 hypothetical protein AN908_15490 [Mycobacteroides immunogenum]KPG20130.1 hypothetical protein AN911_19300 [Mycobacteroides immunogenum]
MLSVTSRFCAALAASALTAVAGASAAHADGPLVFPGMEIVQGTQLCTLGFVDPGARVGLTAGHCAMDTDGPVYDSAGELIGALVIAGSNLRDGDRIDGSKYVIDYEAIKFRNDVAINDILPNGIRLERGSGIEPYTGLPVCRNGVTTGEACGTVTNVNNGWFEIDGLPADHGDSGSAVYSITSPGHGAIVGIARGTTRSVDTGVVQTTAVSWSTILNQLREDLEKSPDIGPSPGDSPAPTPLPAPEDTRFA